MDSKQKITITDVATAAGVGESTVSRVLRNDGSFSPKTQARVLAAAAMLNYLPNRIAGSLASSGSRLVAILVPSLTNNIFSDVVEGAGLHFTSKNYRGVFGVTGYDLDVEARLVAALLEYRPLGVMLSGLEHTDETIAMLKAANCRVVEMMDIDGPGLDIVVGFSNYEAGATAAEYLHERGYSQIGYIGHEHIQDRRAGKRFDGFKNRLNDLGLALAHVEMGDSPSSVSLGRNLLDRAIQNRPTLDAVYFANDDLATGALFHCLSTGIRVPEKLALFGHNGIELSQELPLKLSTVATPRTHVGQLSAKLLLEDGKAQTVNLGFEVIRGETA